MFLRANAMSTEEIGYSWGKSGGINYTVYQLQEGITDFREAGYH